MKGLFITLEGGEGSGKTTAAKRLVEKLEAMGKEVVYTREPGGIEIAEEIRAVILDPKNTMMDARTEALLYAASRRQHLVEKVQPALNEGKVVICDRFVDSSLVYQGIGRGLGIEAVYEMNLFAIGDLMPDCTLFFDVAPEVGLARINANKDREVNRLDMESLAFHHRVYEGYQKILTLYPERIVRIDASLGVDEVYNQVEKVVGRLL